MRSFLPIKGPGGRYLTSREKVALLILGLTLVLCALTLLAGNDAYVDDPGRNPVSAFVAALCRTFGGGVVALYGIVLVWSGLIYFKGEKIADVTPLGGRAFAAAAVAIGLSGALGIGQLDSAGRLGLVVGGALYNTCGDVMGFVFMFALMGIGLNLAGQGAWTALREPTPSGAGAQPGTSAGFGFGINAPEGRQVVPPMPDDGDPSADERSMAVTQAMEEIERSQGVTIVELHEAAPTRPTIGEEVDEAPEPAPETEEAEVRRVVDDIAESLDSAGPYDDDDETEEAEKATDETEDPEEAETATDEAEAYEHSAHGFVPVPASAEETVASEEEAEADDEYEYEEAEDDDEEDSADETDEYEEAEDDEEDSGDETEEYEEAEDDDEADEYEDEVAEDEDDDETEQGEDEEYEYEYEYEEAESEDRDEAAYAEACDDDAEEELEEAEDDEAGPPDERAPTFWDGDGEEEDDEPAAVEEEPATVPIAASDAQDEGVRELGVAQADGCGDEEDSDDDPYAQGGLVRRMRQEGASPVQTDDEDPSPYTSFDWRGHPLE